jgi:hypothetical protein
MKKTIYSSLLAILFTLSGHAYDVDEFAAAEPSNGMVEVTYKYDIPNESEAKEEVVEATEEHKDHIVCKSS